MRRNRYQYVPITPRRRRELKVNRLAVRRIVVFLFVVLSTVFGGLGGLLLSVLLCCIVGYNMPKTVRVPVQDENAPYDESKVRR